MLFAMLAGCNKADDLAEIKSMIQARDYDKALSRLEVILQKDAGNVEANELKIRATMLRKSSIRNKEIAPAEEPVKTGKQPAADAVPAGGAGAKFSIMSLCNEPNDKNLTHIQQRISAKKVN